MMKAAPGTTLPKIRKDMPPEAGRAESGGGFNVGYISANVARRRSFARMTDSVAPSPEVSASVNPAAVLREVLETRVARIEEEIALTERQYRQLQSRINQGQERRDAADAIW